MTDDTLFQVQAYVDGELPADERVAVEALLETDSDAQMMCEALQASRSLLQGEELERTVPESREFYWSKIERAIERETTAADRPASGERSRGLMDWVRWLVPVGGVAALLLISVVSQFDAPPASGGGNERSPSYVEVDHPLDTGSVMTFRSNTEGITVVWIDTD